MLAAAQAMRDVGKRGVQTSWLRKAGLHKVMQRAGDEARAGAAARAPKGDRKKPRYDRAPQGRKFPYMPPGLFRRKATYTYYVRKRPMKVSVVAGTGYKGAGMNNPRKAYAARTSTFPGFGVQYAGGGSPGRILKVFGNTASLVGKRKGMKRKVNPNNWIKPAMEEAGKKYGSDMVRAYDDAVRMRIERAVARGRPY